MEKTDFKEKLYYKYWGKARLQDEAGDACHLLPYHCLDVAAVGYLLLSPDKPFWFPRSFAGTSYERQYAFPREERGNEKEF